jgi:lysine 2,3-aminomutase
MDNYPSGVDPRIIELRRENRERIISLLIEKIDSGEIRDEKYSFPDGTSKEEKQRMMNEWWDNYRFHLHFAVRSPDLLNEMLGHSLDPDTMKILYDAEKAGIPFFVNPYYLSLLHVRVPYFAIGADLAIRHYIVYTAVSSLTSSDTSLHGKRRISGARRTQCCRMAPSFT